MAHAIVRSCTIAPCMNISTCDGISCSVHLACPVQTIVMHKEHDTLYAVDPACRNFSLSILKIMIGIVLENMPGGTLASPHILSIKAYTDLRAHAQLVVLILLRQAAVLRNEVP